MQARLAFEIGRIRLFLGFIHSEIVLLVIDLDVCSPAAESLTPCYARIAGRIALMQAAILLLARVICLAQIANAVVIPDTIDMVYLLFRKCAIYI